MAESHGSAPLTQRARRDTPKRCQYKTRVFVHSSILSTVSMAFTILALSGAPAVVAATASARRETSKATRRPTALGKPAFAARRQSDAGFSKLSSSARTSIHMSARAAGGEVSSLPALTSVHTDANGDVPKNTTLEGLGALGHFQRGAFFFHKQNPNVIHSHSTHSHSTPFLVLVGLTLFSSPFSLLILSGMQGEETDEEENARRTAAGEVDVEVVEDGEEEQEEGGEPEVEEEPVAVTMSRGAELLAQLQEALDNGNTANVLAEVLPELTSEVSEMTEGLGNLKASNVGLEDQAGALKDQYLRLNADFDNYKKRTLKEKEQLAQTARSKLFESMLPGLDNFDLARANLKTESAGEEKIASSYQGLFDGLLTILSSQGLSTVEGVGAAFDPNFHEAIMREESNEYPENTVIEVFRKGYKMGEDTLIRPAMVKVSMEASAPVEGGEGGGESE